MTATPASGSTFFGLDVSGLGDGVQSLARRISRSTLLIEFGARMLQLAEARPRSHGISLRHLTRIELPEGALDRFVPADPVVMAQLLRDECKEKRIFAHRAAVVLPPELAFQRLVHLPQSLSAAEAREFLLDPSSGIQLPFPLEQTDFDITPLGIERSGTSAGSQTLYQLTAIPSTLVEPVLTMLNLSGFDLQSLELGSVSSLRCIKDELIQLQPGSGCLVLDFLSEATLVTLVSSSGPIDSERLPSIREFPQFELVEAAREQVLDRSRSLEEVTVENEGYLPISEMDLRAFERDLEPILANFHQRFPEIVLRDVHLMGEGSAHPALPSLLQDKLKLPVKQCRPLLTKGLRDWAMDEPLLQVRLSRLVGLSLGLLGHDPSTEPDVPVVDAVLESQPDSVNSVADNTSSRLDLIDVSFSEDINPSLSLSVDQTEIQLNRDKEEITDTLGVGVALNQDVEEESKWPSLRLDSSEELVEQDKDKAEVVEEAKEVIKDIEEVGVALNQDVEEESKWPSLRLDSSEELVEQDKAEVVEEAKEVIKDIEEVGMVLDQDMKEESKWPSLRLDSSEELVDKDKDKAEVVEEAKEVIKDIEEVGVALDQDMKEESKWPSLRLDSSEELVDKDKDKDKAEVVEEAKEQIADTEGVGMALNQDVQEDSKWPSLKLDLSEELVEDAKVIEEAKQVIKDVEVVDAVSNQDVKEESKWPSLKLASNEELVERQEAIEEAKEVIKDVEGVGMALNQDVNEEIKWPSLRLDSSEELVDKDKAEVVEETKEVINDIEEVGMALNQDVKEDSKWPSLKLDSSEELVEKAKELISTDSQDASQTTTSEPADSPLGKLRFKSDDP